MRNRFASSTTPRGQSRSETRFRKTMEGIAAENGIEIELVQSKKSFRKEQRVNEILEKRDEEPGLGCIVSAMPPCGRYKPWHDKKTHKTYLKPDDGKCLHDYVAPSLLSSLRSSCRAQRRRRGPRFKSASPLLVHHNSLL